MKKIIASILAIMLFSLCLVSCGGKEIKAEPFTANISVDTAGHTLHNIEIVVKGYGTISATLDETVAPITVRNILELIESGFYNGLTFHRIMEDFMVQGGDPKGDGSGNHTDANGNKLSIKGEFHSNGVENNLLHKRGILSMAREGSYFESYLPYYGSVEALASAAGITVEEVIADLESRYNSASCQFFIMHADSSHLDGAYAAFGWVTAGMNIVDKICADAEPIDNNGSIAQNKQPVIKTIRVVE